MASCSSCSWLRPCQEMVPWWHNSALFCGALYCNVLKCTVQNRIGLFSIIWLSNTVGELKAFSRHLTTNCAAEQATVGGTWFLGINLFSAGRIYQMVFGCLASLNGWCTWHKTCLQMMILGPLSRRMMVRQRFLQKNMHNSHVLCAKFSPARVVLYLQLTWAL